MPELVLGYKDKQDKALFSGRSQRSMENTKIYQKLRVQCNYERSLDKLQWPHKREAFRLIQKESKNLLRDGGALIPGKHKPENH